MVVLIKKLSETSRIKAVITKFEGGATDARHMYEYHYVGVNCRNLTK